MPFPTYANKSEIPKGAEDVYEEKDGKWIPKLPDVSQLEGTLTKVREEKRNAEAAAKAATEKAADLQRQVDAAKLTGNDFEKKSAEMLANWNKEKDAAVKAVQDKLDAVTGELRTVRLDDKLKEHFLNSGGRPERAGKAIADTKHRFDLVDGEIVQKDAKGNVVTEKVTDFYGKTYKTEMPEFYSGTKASGGGAPGGAGTLPSKGDPALVELLEKNPSRLLQIANEKSA